MHKVEIETVLNGWIVTVGCQRVVFNSLEELTKELSRFLTDPIATENEYREKAVNVLHTLGRTPNVTARVGTAGTLTFNNGMNSVCVPLRAEAANE